EICDVAPRTSSPPEQGTSTSYPTRLGPFREPSDNVADPGHRYDGGRGSAGQGSQNMPTYPEIPLDTAFQADHALPSQAMVPGLQMSPGVDRKQYSNSRDPTIGTYAFLPGLNPIPSASAAHPDNDHCGCGKCTRRNPPYSPINDYPRNRYTPSTMHPYNGQPHFPTTFASAESFPAPQTDTAEIPADQRGRFGYVPSLSHVVGFPPGYLPLDSISSGEQTFHSAPSKELMAIRYHGLSIPQNSNDPSIPLRVLKIPLNASISHSPPEPAHAGGIIFSLHSSEKKPHKNSVDKGAAELLQRFADVREDKWGKWKDGLFQEPKGQRKGSTVRNSAETLHKDLICARIDSSITAAIPSEATISALDEVLLKVREGAECKKGVELLRSLVVFYAGNTGDSLSTVILGILAKFKEGWSFLVVDDGTNSNLPSGPEQISYSIASASKPKDGSTHDSGTTLDPQQIWRKSLLIQKDSPPDQDGSHKQGTKRKNFQLGVVNNEGGGSISAENSWDTSQNVLAKLARYFLD
ncbi:4947_t:CDS:1, partial [Acaulospora colombiana]